MAVKQNAPLFIDFTRGRIGTLISKKPNGDRIDIEYRPLGWNFLKKESILNIPKEGLITIPNNEIVTDYDWVLLIDDGTSTVPIISQFMEKNFNELISQLEEQSKRTSLRESAIRTKEKIADSKISEEVKKRIKEIRGVRPRGLKRPSLLRDDEGGEF